MDVELERVTYRFRQPITTAYGTLSERDVLVLRLRDEDGHEGLGEAAPLAGYDDASIDHVRDDLLPAVSALQSADEASVDMAFRAETPQARAAVDMAIRDLHARQAAEPVHLADDRVESVLVNAAVIATDPSAAAREAVAAAQAGFRCVKLKVVGEGDASRVAAVRKAAGQEIAIRVDANGAWTVDQAVAILHAMAPSNLEFCEEPVHGVAAFAEVHRRLGGEVSIAMDETAVEPYALESAASDYVCLKVAAWGLVPLLNAARAARQAGSQPYVSSTYDGPIGIAAGLHAAAALGPDIPACGLATLPLFENVDDPFPAHDGRIEVPRGPGLGVTWPLE